MQTPLSDSQALPQGTHLHEFVIERVLGSGGFGITYLARDTSLNRPVVIKENLPTQFVWRETATGTVRPRHSTGSDAADFEWSMTNFLREAETLASLDHPGIVRVLRKFEANGTAYFVMPFVAGMTLDTLIEDRRGKNKPFSQDELRRLLGLVLEALGYLHRSNIYHRDIKPGNILITKGFIPVLIDFGSARQRISERSLTVIESPGYTPFEQLQSHGNIGPWSDLYALGSALAKAITFKTPPKAADRMMGDPWQGLAANSSLISYTDGFLESIDRAMAVDPRHRWQSALEWSDFLSNGVSVSNAQITSDPLTIPVDSDYKSTDSGSLAYTKPNIPPSRGHTEERVISCTAVIEGVNPHCGRTWEEAYLVTRCPHCEKEFRLQMKAFNRDRFNCPSCGKEVMPSSLREFYPEDASPYIVSLPQLLFSYIGRVGRKEFWLLCAVPGAVLLVLGVTLAEVSFVGILFILCWFVWTILVCLPISVKRLHDHNISGHIMWLILIPYLNFVLVVLLLVILGAMSGNNIPNKYGPPISLLQNPL